jgi:hypothetical protein
MTLSQHSGPATHFSLAPLPVNFQGLPVKEQPASQSASADSAETDIPLALHRQNCKTVGGRLRRLDFESLQQKRKRCWIFLTAFTL